MERPIATQFDTLQDFLKSYVAFRKHVENNFNQKRLSELLGYHTPGYVSNIMNKKRASSSDFIERLDKLLNFTPDELRWLTYQKILSSKKNQNSDLVRETFKPMVDVEWNALNLEIDRFALISNWYHYAILELTQVKDFHCDPEWIVQKLGNKVSIMDIEGALKRLVRLGLIIKKNDTYKKSHKSLFVISKIPSAVVRNHHLQMLEKAKVALMEQGIEDREYTGSTISIKTEDRQKLKDLIRRFNNELHKLSTGVKADDVVRINVQMFKLTV